MQAWLSVNLRANQLVVGIGFNILALGATTLLYRIIFGGLSREEIPGLPKLAVPRPRATCRSPARRSSSSRSSSMSASA